MKKIVTTIALLSTLTFAGEHPIEVGIGYAPGDNNGDMITTFASMTVFSGLGARLEYTTNINEGNIFVKEDVSRYGLYAMYNLPITSYLSLTPKMGIVQNDSTISVSDVLGSVNGSSTEFTYGLEVNYNYNEKIAFYLGYTDYGNNFDFNNFNSDYMDSANFSFGLKVGI